MLSEAWTFLVLGGAVHGYEAYKTYRAKKLDERASIYLFSAGYRLDVQRKLELSSNEQLEEQLGRPFEHTADGRKKAIAEILKRQAIGYFDYEEVRRTNPKFREAAGLPTLPGDVTYEEYLALHPPAPLSPQTKARVRREDTIFFSIVGAIILIPIIIWLCFFLRPPIPAARIGMSLQSWSSCHMYVSNRKETTDIDTFHIYKSREKIFGSDANVYYAFNGRNRLEYIYFDFDNYSDVGYNMFKRYGQGKSDSKHIFIDKQGYNYEVISRYDLGKPVVYIQRRGNLHTEKDCVSVLRFM